ncbi:MAG: hypothetical protein IPQ14_15950 [Candidatus Microthrix sp.]|jgi:hypothetical protein|uniref:hypothetical protein n=1 Tax=Candidatus Neomicrothrix sp. TaxID=2719034 RepID=UPI001B680BA4|nr:hypothetical protein [Candidatus Microthrix sp.]MBK7018644.1 hypothetical protein [Candidatus Microthrix sp.]MBL0205772.1 hypothetical protein [Candidatus Microthrix sp.]MBP7985980.1 hypothetical protein [Candidatus Microthrix sp.]
MSSRPTKARNAAAIAVLVSTTLDRLESVMERFAERVDLAEFISTGVNSPAHGRRVRTGRGSRSRGSAK